MARASGVARDVRVDAPYARLPDLPGEAGHRDGGRPGGQVRRAARGAVRELPRDPRDSGQPAAGRTDACACRRRIPAGETISRVEAPRGELFYFIKSAGGRNPDRVKVRTPSLCNWGIGARHGGRATSWPTCRC
ncbi:MAG: hypothetical protein MZU79_00585 [Anaerotruncus sp.]|nr:hypothetical protein [Anaerotruncus sp.]